MQTTEEDRAESLVTVGWKGNPAVKQPKQGKIVRSENSRHKTHTCTFCGTSVQDLSRHYRNVHSKPGEHYVEPQYIEEAKLANKIRLIDQDNKTDLLTCPKCLQPRKRLREHLIAAHQIAPASEELEALLPPKGTWSYQISPDILEIAMSIEDFSKEFSSNLAGSRPRLKEKSFDTGMKARARSTHMIMGFISKSTGQTTVLDCLSKIDILGDKSLGFVTSLVDGTVTGNKNKYTTAKKHLANFQDYLRYLKQKCESDNQRQIVSTAKEMTLRIMKNLGPFINNQDLERRLDEENLGIGESAIEAYRKTSKALKADEILLSKNPPSLAEAVQARDHLITLIILENCARPSELTDLRLADMKRGISVTNQATGEQEISYVSTLGKVGASGQPAFLLLKLVTESKLRGYLETCNTILRQGQWNGKDQNDIPVFLTMRGKAMDDEAISNAWRRAWKRAGKECPNIPTECKSRHLRTTGNDVVWVHGDEVLKRTIHLSFAHSKEVNKTNYRNKSRRILAVQSKQKMLALRKVHTSATKVRNYPKRKTPQVDNPNSQGPMDLFNGANKAEANLSQENFEGSLPSEDIIDEGKRIIKAPRRVKNYQKRIVTTSQVDDPNSQDPMDLFKGANKEEANLSQENFEGSLPSKDIGDEGKRIRKTPRKWDDFVM